MPRASAAPVVSFADPLHVTKIHRRSNPNSHSYHVTAAGGAQYMLKVFPPNEAQERFFREAYASELGSRLGLSMAHWSVLQIDDQTCRQELTNQEPSFGGNRLPAGIYYGSRILDGPGQPRLYLSERLVQANPMISWQLGCIRLFDVWLANTAMRGYCVIMNGVRAEHVYFYGNSKVFVPEKPVAYRKRVADAYASACKIAANTRHVHCFLGSIHTFKDADMREALSSVPAIWRTPSFELHAISMLRFRRDNLISALREEVTSQETKLPAELMCDTAYAKHSRAVVSFD